MSEEVMAGLQCNWRLTQNKEKSDDRRQLIPRQAFNPGGALTGRATAQFSQLACLIFLFALERV